MLFVLFLELLAVQQKRSNFNGNYLSVNLIRNKDNKKA